MIPPLSAASSAVSAQPFSQAWSLEDTRALCDSTRGETFTAKAHELIERLAVAVSQHLLHRAQTQGLSLPPYTEAAQTPLLSAWRAAAAAEALPLRDAKRLGDRFAHVLLSMQLSFRKKGLSLEEEASAVHEHFVDVVSRGNFSGYSLGQEVCQASGKLLVLRVDGDWEPKAFVFKEAAYAWVPLPAGEISPPRMEHVVLDVPSGKLLVSDWFDHPALDALVDTVEEKLPGLSSEQANAARTQALAKELGIATVFVANSFPCVVVEGASVRIGTLDHEETTGGLAQPSGQTVGGVITGKWWATLVDKQTLVDLVARSLPPDRALREVEAMVREGGSTIVEVTVPPGQYHLYFAGEPATFGKECDFEGVDWSGFREPMCILSPTPLAPRAARAPTPKR